MATVPVSAYRGARDHLREEARRMGDPKAAQPLEETRAMAKQRGSVRP